MTLSFSLNGASDSSDDPNSISLPFPLAHQCGGEMPSPMNMQANRCGVFAFSAAIASRPNADIDSSHGKATEAPSPLSNTRREMAG